ncbi:hypothetical protein V8017_10065 [Stenotrophomonas rhizophila]
MCALGALPEGAGAAQDGFAGGGDGDEALAGVVAALFPEPAGEEEGFEVAGEGGAVHAEGVGEFA